MSICSGVSYCHFFRSNAFLFQGKRLHVECLQELCHCYKWPGAVGGRDFGISFAQPFVALSWGCSVQMESANHLAAKLKPLVVTCIMGLLPVWKLWKLWQFFLETGKLNTLPKWSSFLKVSRLFKFFFEKAELLKVSPWRRGVWVFFDFLFIYFFKKIFSMDNKTVTWLCWEFSKIQPRGRHP